MKKIIRYSLMLSLALALSLFINIKASEKIEVHGDIINDLAGTKWLLNSNVSAPSGFGIFNINYYVDDPIYSLRTHIQIGYSSKSSTSNNSIFYRSSTGTVAYNSYGWSNQAFRTITIVGGSDSINTIFINWLTDNANLIYELNTFNVGDVLPASMIRIRWTFSSIYAFDTVNWSVKTGTSSTYIFINFISDIDEELFSVFIDPMFQSSIILSEDSWINPYTGVSGNHAYFDVDLSLFSIDKRTIKSNDLSNNIYWEELPSYSITFEENGGSTVTDLTNQTSLPSPLPTTTKFGYTFNGWYYESNFTTQAQASHTLSANVTLYAKWTKDTYTITYNSNGGTNISPLEDITHIPSTLPIPNKLGYTFKGWFTDSGLTTSVTPETEIFENTTLYAKFVANKLNIIYYDSSTDLLISPYSVYYGDSSPLPATSKIGYDFIGWYLEPEFINDITFFNELQYLMEEDNISLYAKFEIKKYTVKLGDQEYLVNHGGDLSDVDFTPPTKPLYVFSHWSIYPGYTFDPLTYVVTSDVEIFPQFNFKYDIEVKLVFKLTEFDTTLFDLQRLVDDYYYFMNNMGQPRLFIDKVEYFDFEYDIFEIANNLNYNHIFAYFNITVNIDGDLIELPDQFESWDYSDYSPPTLTSDMFLYKTRNSVLLKESITALLKPYLYDVVDDNPTMFLISDGYTGNGNKNGIYELEYQLLDRFGNFKNVIFSVIVDEYNFYYYFNGNISIAGEEYSKVTLISDLKKIGKLPDTNLQYQIVSDFYDSDELTLTTYPLSLSYQSTSGFSGMENFNLNLVSYPKMDVIEEEADSMFDKLLEILIITLVAFVGFVIVKNTIEWVVKLKKTSYRRR